MYKTFIESIEDTQNNPQPNNDIVIKCILFKVKC